MMAEPLDQLPDDLLVERFQTSGEAVFFETIFRRHRQAVFQCCLAMLRDREAAADLTQETFLKALVGIRGYLGGQLRAWLVTIARHQCINHIRSLHRGTRIQEGPESLELVEVSGEDVVGKLTVRNLLAPLTEEQRLCLKLFHFNGMSYSEIADLTCLDEKSVKSHIQNGMRRMRRAQADCGTK